MYKITIRYLVIASLFVGSTAALAGEADGDLRLASQYLKSREFAKASAASASAVAKEPQSFRARFFLAYCLAAQGNRDEAIAAYGKVLELNGKDPGRTEELVRPRVGNGARPRPR